MSTFRARLGVVLAAVMTFALLYIPANEAKAAGATFDPKADYAASFNGNDSYGESVGAVIPTTGDYTVEAWVYDSSASDGMREIIAQGDDVNNFYMGDIWGGTRVAGASELPAIKREQWFHIAVTHGSSGSIIWVNGRAIAKAWGLGNPGDYNLNVGRQFLSYGEFWKGKIDEIKIWNVDRSNMVASDMNTYGAGTFGTGLIAYYDFNTPTVNGDGTITVPDLSGVAASHPLTMHNMTAGDFVDVAETVSWGTDARDALVTFPRPYLNAQGGWTAPTGFDKFQALVVGGGGGGGAWIGGGGGGGGVVETAEATFTAGTKYTVAVGMGGSGAAYRDGNYNRYGVYNTGYNGSPSAFNGTTMAMGGGKGGSYGDFGQFDGVLPGSGANGGGASGSDQDINGASASTNAVGGLSTAIGGYKGGDQVFPWSGLLPAAGGGGAGGAGQNASSDGRTAGNGGPGKLSSITSLKYGGGGGGGLHNTLDVTDAGVLGQGFDGGSNGAGPSAVGQSEIFAPHATANTGGGGGGAAMNGNFTSVGGDGASGVIILRLVAPPVAAQTSIYQCDGLSTLNGIKVTALHPKIFYIDSGDDQKMDANYLDYKVTSSTARSDLWVELSNFTGGSVTLANPADSAQPVGTIAAANGSGAAYFLAKASKASTGAQSHTVKVYDRKPGSGGAVPLYTCSFSFTRVDETIKASANKVDSITTTSVSSLGTTFTITVLGDSGTIGAGNSVDGRLLWLSPASRSSWPTGALRLEDATISTYSDSGRTTLLKTYVNTLALNAAAGVTTHNRQYYKAVYTFRIIGNAPSVAAVSPSAMISSGTQMKHVDMDSIPTGTGTKVNVVAPAQEVSVTSSASRTTEVRNDGTTRITYTVKVENKGSKEVELDEVHDHGDDEGDEDYVKGSTKKNGKSHEDAEHDDDDEHDYVLSGPVKVPGKSSVTYTYQVEVKTCRVGDSYEYEHHSEGRSGGSHHDEDEDHDGHDDDGDDDHDGHDDHDDHSEHIGSSAHTDSHVKVTGDCGEETAAVSVKNVVQAPDVTTGTALPVGTTTATVYGTIDSQTVAGLPVKFTYGTSPSLVAGSTATLATTTAGLTPYAVNKALTGLTPGTRYYYRLTVTTPTRDVSGAIYHFDTQLPPGVPTAVTAPVTAISNSDKGALFTGAVTAARVSGGAKVRFEWAADSSNGACTTLGAASTSGNLKNGSVDAVLNNAGATGMTYRALGLTASANYCVRVVALHGNGYTTRVEGDWVPFTQAPKTAQTITFASQQPPLPAGGSTAVSAGASSILPVTYVSNDTAICTVDASTGAVTAVADSGVCSITATQDGDDTYYAALPKTMCFDIIPPIVTTPDVPRGIYRNAFTSTTLEADGGNGTFGSWTLIGSLPAGLTLSSAGVLSGTPTTSGVFSFGVTVESNRVTSAPRYYSMVIESAPLVATAASVTVAFGDAVPAVSASYSGFLGPDTASDIAVAPDCFTTYSVGTAAGASGKLTNCKDGWDENYTLSYAPGSVTINKFDVTVTAIDKAKQNLSNGTVRPDPAFEYLLTPLPGGQTVANVFPNGVNMTRTAGESAGDYPIDISATAVGSNYNVTYVDGVLTVQNPQPVPALTATDYSVTYGEALGAGLTGTATVAGNAVPGSWVFTYTDADGVEQTVDSTSKLPAGLYTVVAEFTPTDSVTYYGPVQTVLNVTVNKKVVTITSDELAKVVGALDPDLTYGAAGFLPGDALDDLGLVEVTRVPGELPGTYDVITAGGSNPNYTVAHVKATFYISRISIVKTTNVDGSSPRTVSLTCLGNKPGSTVTLFLDGVSIGTVTVAANGTCPANSFTVPTSVAAGPHNYTATGMYPSGATLTAESPVILGAVPTNNGGGNNNGGGVVTPTKQKVTEVFSGFAEGSPVLTASMKAEIKAWVNAHPKLTKLTCVGYTMGRTVLSTDAALSRNRAVAACNYIKQLKPSIKVVSVSGVQQTKFGAVVRRVELTLSNY